MIDPSTNSLLHLDLLKLRQFNDIGVTKYKKTYPDNEVYRIFVKTHSVGKDRIIPLYFDFTDMMIRKCQKELEILECQFNSEHFKSAIIEYLNFDYKINDWYSIECADVDKYKAFYKTLEDLSGVLLPTLNPTLLWLFIRDKTYLFSLVNSKASTIPCVSNNLKISDGIKSLSSNLISI